MAFNVQLALMLSAALMSACYAYYPDIKDTYVQDAFLRDLIDAMAAQDVSDDYSNDDPLMANSFDFLSRAQKDQTERLMDYDSILERTNPHPSLRDEEHTQHSSLWGYQFVSGGAGEGEEKVGEGQN